MIRFQHEGINLEGERDAGSCIIKSFSIIPGNSESVAHYLLDLLEPNTTFSLSNDHDDGATTFRIIDGLYQSLSGGHGRSGSWTTAGREVMIKKIRMLSQFNNGDYGGQSASLVAKK